MDDEREVERDAALERVAKLEAALETMELSFRFATNDAIRGAANRVCCSKCYDAVMTGLDEGGDVRGDYLNSLKAALDEAEDRSKLVLAEAEAEIERLRAKVKDRAVDGGCRCGTDDPGKALALKARLVASESREHHLRDHEVELGKEVVGLKERLAEACEVIGALLAYDGGCDGECGSTKGAGCSPADARAFLARVKAST